MQADPQWGAVQGDLGWTFCRHHVVLCQSTCGCGKLLLTRAYSHSRACLCLSQFGGKHLTPFCVIWYLAGMTQLDVCSLTQQGACLHALVLELATSKFVLVTHQQNSFPLHASS